jgi:hypothetical protein
VRQPLVLNFTQMSLVVFHKQCCTSLFTNYDVCPTGKHNVSSPSAAGSRRFAAHACDLATFLISIDGWICLILCALLLRLVGLRHPTTRAPGLSAFIQAMNNVRKPDQSTRGKGMQYSTTKRTFGFNRTETIARIWTRSTTSRTASTFLRIDRTRPGGARVMKFA